MAEGKSKDYCIPCYEEKKIKISAVGYCQDCDDYLCEKCFDLHRIPKPSKNHRLITSRETTIISDDTGESLNDLKDELCRKHTGQKTEIYCLAHNTVICCKCCYEEHSVCKTAHLPDFKENYLFCEYVNRCLKRLHEANARADNNQRQIGETFVKLEATHKSFDQSIDIFAGLVTDKILQLYNDIKQEVACMRQNNTLSFAMDCNKNALKEINATIHKIETCRKSKHPSRLFVELNDFENIMQLIERDIQNAVTNNDNKAYVFKECAHLQRILCDGNVCLGTFEDVKSGSEINQVNIC